MWYFPIFTTARVAKKIWRIIKTIASILRENMLGYLSLGIIYSSKRTVYRATLSENCEPRKTEFLIHQIFLLARDWFKHITWLNIPPTGEYPRDIRKFVLGHYLFLELTDNVRGRISENVFVSNESCCLESGKIFLVYVQLMSLIWLFFVSPKSWR